jgi:hypothetical protein
MNIRRIDSLYLRKRKVPWNILYSERNFFSVKVLKLDKMKED